MKAAPVLEGARGTKQAEEAQPEDVREQLNLQAARVQEVERHKAQTELVPSDAEEAVQELIGK